MRQAARIPSSATKSAASGFSSSRIDWIVEPSFPCLARAFAASTSIWALTKKRIGVTLLLDTRPVRYEPSVDGPGGPRKGSCRRNSFTTILRVLLTPSIRPDSLCSRQDSVRTTLTRAGKARSDGNEDEDQRTAPPRDRGDAPQRGHGVPDKSLPGDETARRGARLRLLAEGHPGGVLVARSAPDHRPHRRGAPKAGLPLRRPRPPLPAGGRHRLLGRAGRGGNHGRRTGDLHELRRLPEGVLRP